MMLRTVLLVICVLLNACSDYREITVGNDTFMIPKSNVGIVSGDIDKRLDEGYDTSSLMFSVSWSPEEMSKAIPGYFESRDNFFFHVSAALYAPSAEKLAYRRSNEPYKDAFLLIGDFQGARVEYDEKTNTYKVFGPFGSEKYWVAFRIKPGDPATLPERGENFLIGPCSHVQEISCHTPISYRNYELDVSMPGPNMHLRDQIKDFIIAQLESWRVK